MPTRIKDHANGHSDVPDELTPALPHSPSWRDRAGKWLARFQWEFAGITRDGSSLLWADPLGGGPAPDEIVRLPDGNGGYQSVRQKVVPAPNWPTTTYQSVVTQWGRVLKHGGGIDG